MRLPDDMSAAARGVGRRWLWAIFFLALAARAGWGVARLVASHDVDRLSLPDEEQYWLMAKSLLAGGGLRDELGFRAGRMPLYPGFLAMFAGLAHGAAWAKGAQWIIGALAAVWATRLGATAHSRGAGIIAGLLVALDPYLVYTSSLLLTETLFITALVGLWAAGLTWMQAAAVGVPANATRDRWALAVMCISAVACVYLREAAVAFVLALAVMLGGWCPLSSPRVTVGAPAMRRRPRGWSAGACVLSVMLLSLVPWALRNREALGGWVWLTTRGGITLYDGVRPDADGSSDLGGVKAGPDVREFVERSDERAWDDHFRQAAFACVRSDPWRILRLAPVKFVRTWSLTPNLAEGRSLLFSTASAVWTVGVYAFALIGVYHGWRGRRAGRSETSSDDATRRIAGARWSVVALAAPALVVALLHSVYVGSVRYRLPAMPFLETLAAIGAWRVVSTLAGPREPKAENLVATTE